MKMKSKNVTIVFIVAVVFVTLIIVLTRHWRVSTTRSCDDGIRNTIDIADFTTNYFAYSVELSAQLDGKTKFEGKISPVQLQQLSESLQSANEFRKALVAGYNACAISKSQYATYLHTFQALDGLSRQIATRGQAQPLTEADRDALKHLVNEYIRTAQTLGG